MSKADGAALALRFGCLFFEVSACLDFLSVQHIFHEAVREVRRETERSIRPLFISEDKSAISLSSAPPLTTCYKELPTPATAKLVTVKSSRAQSKRRAPTLTLLKGFKIFWCQDALFWYSRGATRRNACFDVVSAHLALKLTGPEGLQHLSQTWESGNFMRMDSVLNISEC